MVRNPGRKRGNKELSGNDRVTVKNAIMKRLKTLKACISKDTHARALLNMILENRGQFKY